MNSVWRSLLWKEWREHRWKLVFLGAACVVLPTAMAFAFGRKDGANGHVGAIISMLVLFLPLGAMFLGSWIGAGEHSRNTVNFVQALPAPMWKSAAAKLAWSAATVLTPVALAVAIIAAWAALGDGPTNRNLDNAALLVGFVGLASLSLLAWMAAAGVNQCDEVRAGAIGVIVIVAIWGLLTLVALWTAESVDDDWQWSLWLVAAAAPGSPAGAINLLHLDRLGAHEFSPGVRLGRLWPFAAVALATHLGVGAWYLRRFGRVAKPQAAVAAPMATTERGWLAPPRRSPLSAIFWKQVRESTPLAATGAAAVTLLAVLLATTFARLFGAPVSEAEFEAVFASYVSLGFFVAVIAGIGVFLDDLRPRLHTFWRSRPIRLAPWFAVKVTTSLVMTIVSLAALPLAFACWSWWSGATRSWVASNDAFQAIGAAALFHTGAFLLAVCAIVLLRGAVAAAFATLGAVVVLGMLGDRLVESPSAWIVVALVAGVGVAATTVAWLALKNDWRWNR